MRGSASTTCFNILIASGTPVHALQNKRKLIARRGRFWFKLHCMLENGKRFLIVPRVCKRLAYWESDGRVVRSSRIRSFPFVNCARFLFGCEHKSKMHVSFREIIFRLYCGGVFLFRRPANRVAAHKVFPVHRAVPRCRAPRSPLAAFP